MDFILIDHREVNFSVVSIDTKVPSNGLGLGHSQPAARTNIHCKACETTVESFVF